MGELCGLEGKKKGFREKESLTSLVFSGSASASKLGFVLQKVSVSAEKGKISLVAGQKVWGVLWGGGRILASLLILAFSHFQEREMALGV